MSEIKQSTLIVNGDDDIMVLTEPNTYDLQRMLKNNKLIIYPDAGHGSIAQFNKDFVRQVNEFL